MEETLLGDSGPYKICWYIALVMQDLPTRAVIPAIVWDEKHFQIIISLLITVIETARQEHINYMDYKQDYCNAGVWNHLDTGTWVYVLKLELNLKLASIKYS